MLLTNVVKRSLKIFYFILPNIKNRKCCIKYKKKSHKEFLLSAVFNKAFGTIKFTNLNNTKNKKRHPMLKLYLSRYKVQYIIYIVYYMFIIYLTLHCEYF